MEIIIFFGESCQNKCLIFVQSQLITYKIFVGQTITNIRMISRSIYLGKNGKQYQALEPKLLYLFKNVNDWLYKHS